MTQSEIKEIIIRLKKNEMNVFDVPEECKNAIDIVNIERKLGCRLIGKRGFDIISNSFFVEEHLVLMQRVKNREKLFVRHLKILILIMIF